MSLATPPNYEGDSVKIISSAGSNAMQTPGRYFGHSWAVAEVVKTYATFCFLDTPTSAVSISAS